MGGRRKKQTVGYRYRIGMHLVLCQGPVDAVQEIQIGDRSAWGDASTCHCRAAMGWAACASIGPRSSAATNAKAAWWATSTCSQAVPRKTATTT